MNETLSLLERYRLMLVMRHFEEACAQGVPSGELRGELHLASGHEAIAAGMVGPLEPQDWMVSTHRSHQHAIAKGVSLQAMLAEIYEKATGLCGGKGGHLHLFDLEARFSSTGIVGSSLPVALGHAYAARLEGDDSIAVAMTGDGGTNTGQFHETMNMAAIWKLPLVIVVENNFYAISVPAEEVTARPGIAERARAYSAWGERIDGTDVETVVKAFGNAVDHARSGQGPAILEATCYRFRGHYEGDVDHYRTKEYRDRMFADFDPILIARRRLIEAGQEQKELDRLEDEVSAEVTSLLEQARSAPEPDPASVFDDVFVGGSL